MTRDTMGRAMRTAVMSSLFVAASSTAHAQDATGPTAAAETEADVARPRFQIGPRLGGLVAPTFAAEPIAGVVLAGLDLGVRYGSNVDLRITPSFIYEESGYESGRMFRTLRKIT